MPSISELVRSRILSLAFALFLLVLTYIFTRNMEPVFRLLAILVLPLACIWFADEIGIRTGITIGLSKPRITEPTPGIAVAIGGWILLLSIMAAIIIVNR